MAVLNIPIQVLAIPKPRLAIGDVLVGVSPIGSV
jgi:hypothetical protein